MDSVPVVAVTCNVGVPLLGKDSFQEVDIAGVVMPITKHSFIVKDVTKLAKTLRRAFAIAKVADQTGPSRYYKRCNSCKRLNTQRLSQKKSNRLSLKLKKKI